MNMVPMPSSVSISMSIACGIRPSMMNTLCTPHLTAFMQHSTLGIMPPLIMPCSISSGAWLIVILGISVAGSSLSFRMPQISVIEMRLAAPSSPAIFAAAVSALML